MYEMYILNNKSSKTTSKSIKNSSVTYKLDTSFLKSRDLKEIDNKGKRINEEFKNNNQTK